MTIIKAGVLVPRFLLILDNIDPLLKPRLWPGFFFALFLLISCAHQSTTHTALSQAKNQKFTHHSHQADDFTIFALSKNIGTQNNIYVFVEGDGLAWLDKRTPSNDPTPIRPIALNMAIQKLIKEPNAGVIYLGRPCQYDIHANKCDPKYWTHARFSKKIVQEMNLFLDVLLKSSSSKKISLIGFSGGGVIAGLIAAQRNDVVFWQTYASPLDIQKWTQYHKISPLRESDNLYSYIDKIKKLPQEHCLSNKDKIVPPVINQAFFLHLEALGTPVKVHVDNNKKHEDW